MAELLERLKARTSAVRQPGRGPVYNHPPLWYAKPDGDVVSLQGDPQNRAYYTDKGYAVLRPEEVEEWLRVVRPQVLAETRARARLITGIRQIAARHPGVEVLSDLNAASVEELQGFLDAAAKAGGAVTVIGSRAAPEDDDDPADRGTEMGAGDALADKIARSAERSGALPAQKRGA